MDDCRYVPLPNSASNVKFGRAFGVGSEDEIGLFSPGSLGASGSHLQARPRKCCKVPKSNSGEY